MARHWFVLFTLGAAIAAGAAACAADEGDLHPQPLPPSETGKDPDHGGNFGDNNAPPSQGGTDGESSVTGPDAGDGGSDGADR